MVFRQQRPRDIDLAAADMGVHVDSAGHDDAPPAIDFLGDSFLGRGRRNDTAVPHEDVLHHAVDAMLRIIDTTASELDQPHLRPPLPAGKLR